MLLSVEAHNKLMADLYKAATYVDRNSPLLESTVWLTANGHTVDDFLGWVAIPGVELGVPLYRSTVMQKATYSNIEVFSNTDGAVATQGVTHFHVPKWAVDLWNIARHAAEDATYAPSTRASGNVIRWDAARSALYLWFAAEPRRSKLVQGLLAIYALDRSAAIRQLVQTFVHFQTYARHGLPEVWQHLLAYAHNLEDRCTHVGCCPPHKELQ